MLYAEIGSLEKLLNYWQGTEGRLKATERRPELEALMERLGKPPALTTLKEWSIKYQWTKRKEIKIAEDLEILREKTKKIKREKLHKIAEIFERIMNKVLKGLRGDYEPTISELKMVWEMFQIELGKPTTRAQLNTEPEQRPLTPEEKEHGKRVHLAVKWYLDNELDKEENWQEFQKLIEKNGKKR
ncbi:MAG: hypothetical protein GX428_09450 [Candidatus Atribacteria bacterium]|nr:hypothetical protein [Candidatus Atribacteria bacterium]